MGRKKSSTSDLDVLQKANAPFAARLNKLLGANGNMKELADVLGVSQQAISQYRNGQIRPSLDNILIIANFFQVSTDYLLGRTDDPSTKPVAVDDLHLPISVCDMLLYNLDNDSLEGKRRCNGFQLLAETREFFQFLEAVGTLVEKDLPYCADKIPEEGRARVQNILQPKYIRSGAVERARRTRMEFDIKERYPDLEGRHCDLYGKEYKTYLETRAVMCAQQAVSAVKQLTIETEEDAHGND